MSDKTVNDVTLDQLKKENAQRARTKGGRQVRQPHMDLEQLMGKIRDVGQGAYAYAPDVEIGMVSD